MSSTSNTAPEARTAMLIRRSTPEVFAAFVEPDQVTRYWFSHASGPLAPNAVVEWTWAPYGASATVRVLEFEPERRVLTEWPSEKGPTRVEYRFTPQPDGTTWVEVTETGFGATGADLISAIADATQGFTLVLAGLKAWCEHRVQLNLIWDRYPSGLVTA